ncbi:hypothetical protein BUALT_Bualt09G0057500 [Buddleja alternifolia]|uniref:Pentatricopeptide repeat-containing protein n=1 Tax=Buddleja alternifolia TaxID=168488 RepID=A0AAV6X7K4_9LAMI|nr:hypothetical protein BUALT_Bualt09G0057500 [Buddleja alternifolia]
MKGFRRGVSLHADAIKAGTQAETFIGNHILNFYAKCDHTSCARQVFDEMSHRNLVTWSAMISGYNQSSRPNSAIGLFGKMQKYFRPNEFVFASALSSCSVVKDVNLGQQIHAQALKLGHSFVSFVRNSLILMYMKCRICSDALSIFTDTGSGFPTLVSYNIAITGLVEDKKHKKGTDLFKIMCRQGLVPDRFTFAGLLGSGEPVFDLSVVMQLHCQMVKFGLDYMAFSGNVLITLYSKCNLTEESKNVFRSIVEKDAISWNTFIAACCRCEDNINALGVFREMLKDYNVRPDDFTYASVLSAAAGQASMRHGKEIHACLIRTSPHCDVGVGNALVNMYAKSGSINAGYTIFKQMEIHNLVSWNSIISGFANQGLAKKAISLFEEMMRTGLKPDSVTFLELLTACNHSGLLNEGQALFNSMSTVYGINPNSEHLCCLVDLLGRAGRVNKAEEYTRKYSTGDDVVVLGCLLSACRMHGSVNVGERTGKRLLELHPITTSPYVLLSNLYASDRRWDGVAGARKMLQVSGLKKEAAYSMIEVKGSVEKFIIGDFSHSRMDDILNLLKTLSGMKDEHLLCY